LTEGGTAGGTTGQMGVLMLLTLVFVGTWGFHVSSPGWGEHVPF